MSIDRWKDLEYVLDLEPMRHVEELDVKHGGNLSV